MATMKDGGHVCPKCGADVIRHDDGSVTEHRLYAVVLYGAMHRKCWVSHLGHDYATARDIAETKSWSLDGVAMLFKGKVEPKDVVNWYRRHSTMSNHPGLFKYVPRGERSSWEKAKDRTTLRFQCPICHSRPVRDLHGVEKRDTICTNCHAFWLKP